MTKKAIAHKLLSVRYELDWLQRREQAQNLDWRFRSAPYSKHRVRLVKTYWALKANRQGKPNRFFMRD